MSEKYEEDKYYKLARECCAREGESAEPVLLSLASDFRWLDDKRAKDVCEWKLTFKGDARKQQWITGCGAGCAYKDTDLTIEKFCFNCGRPTKEAPDGQAVL